MKRATSESYFWSKVERGSGCWVWNGRRNEGGYGTIGSSLAHRRAFELLVGPIPAGHDVLHRCDNPPCVNPAHLFPGSDSTNAGDRHRKGRDARGSGNARSKLSEADVSAIRTRYAAGSVSQCALAAEFGVTPSNISHVLRRHTWKWLLYAALCLSLLAGIQAGGRQADRTTRPLHLRTVAASSANRSGPCSGNRHYEVHHWMTPKVQHRHVEALIGCAVDRWAVPGGYDKALSVARCESSLYAWAYSNGNAGIYQIRSWDTRARTYLKRRWFPHHGFPPRWQLARANVLTAIRWVSRANSWSAWACS